MVQATVWELSGVGRGCVRKDFLEGEPLVSVLPRPGPLEVRPSAEVGLALAGRCGAAAQCVGIAHEVAVVGAQVLAEAEGSSPVTLTGLTLADGSAG